MDGKTIIKKRLEEHQDVISRLLTDESIQQVIQDTVEAITTCFRNGGKVYFCGNGGSAADAQHLAAEFSGKFYLDREVLPAEALHCNTSYLTAVSNDYSFDLVYARLIAGLANPGDILIGLSTSGSSTNVVKAFEVCRKNRVTTIGFTGENGGEMAPLSDFLINVPASDTPRIQEAHITIGHIICEWVEANIFKN